jgi:hypothetical protein
MHSLVALLHATHLAFAKVKPVFDLIATAVTHKKSYSQRIRSVKCYGAIGWKAVGVPKSHTKAFLEVILKGCYTQIGRTLDHKIFTKTFHCESDQSLPNK